MLTITIHYIKARGFFLQSRSMEISHSDLTKQRSQHEDKIENK